MRKLTLQAMALGMALGITGAYAQSTQGGSGPAGKPSSGAVGSGQAADKGGTGASAPMVGSGGSTSTTSATGSTTSDTGAGTTTSSTKSSKSKTTEGPTGKTGAPASGSVGSGDPAPRSEAGPSSGMGGGTGSREGMNTK
jgi:hypothetical protein